MSSRRKRRSAAEISKPSRPTFRPGRGAVGAFPKRHLTADDRAQGLQHLADVRKALERPSSPEQPS